MAQLKKLRLREAGAPAQGHTAGKLSLGLCVWLMLFAITSHSQLRKTSMPSGDSRDVRTWTGSTRGHSV